MSVRIDSLIVSVNALFLAVAFAYFLMLSRRQLVSVVFSRQRDVATTLVVVSMSGIVGAMAYGRVGAAYALQSSGMPPSILSFGAGSFGGYWGVLAATVLVALINRQNVLLLADAFVPGMLVGGAIARTSDLITGSVRGITIHWEVLGEFQPFRYWPACDIAAQLFTLWIASICYRRTGASGTYLIAFLVVYGFARFGLEFARDTHHWIGPLTHGHILAAIQCVVGIAIWIKSIYLEPDRNHCLRRRQSRVPHFAILSDHQ